MPPFIPKKRHATTPPPAETASTKKKPKLGNDKESKPKSLPRRQKTKQPVYTVSDDSDSSLSSIDSVEFENIALGKSAPRKTASQPAKDAEDSDDSDEVQWENAIEHEHPTYAPTEPAKVSGGVQFSLEADEDEFGGFAAASLQRKQGISKAEKATRIVAHQLHVQFLLLHNAFRNRWISDRVVQKTLMDQLPAQIKSEVDKWRRASGFVEQDTPKKATSKKQKGRKEKPVNVREERDWGRPSMRLDEGKADMSSGDPIISLLKVLSAYWKKRFAITAPGLRKRGYSTRLERRKEVNSFKNDPHDPEKHGERIQSVQEFREVAKKCEGSRDVGAQLFTALLRALGIEARLVASLQPAGFGATKAEEMTPKKPGANSTAAKAKPDTPSSSESDVKLADIETINSSKKKKKEGKSKKARSARQSGGRAVVKDSASTSAAASESDDDSIIDVTPTLPKRKPALYDREVPYPIYWTEAVSPITNKVFPVSPLVLERSVATNEETLGGFEPRGAKADKAKLVMAYVVAYSPDGTAKDVTVRYLRKHIWPGKTKSFRFPIEKIPVYDRAGRIKRYEDYDWFKHIMSAYTRTDKMRTAVDDVEESTDLVPQQPEKKQIDDTVDTLSSLKASPDFVLERFLRREEAIRPGAEPDRMFASGKGDTLKEEPVYLRADVERCLTTESWHKEGRIPKLGEAPLKHVPVRAVTITRKREAEEHERITGEKQLQGLYSWDQTEYIIPPPIENGAIPKNSFGNIDAFVPSMIPKGASHIPLKGCLRICKRLEIDFAEAVVGFEFGNKRAVPVIKGVVVAKENEKKVREEWKKWNEEQKRKEEMKLEKLCLEMWRKFIVGLKIRKRVQAQYGEDVELGSSIAAVEHFPAKTTSGVSRAEAIDVDDDGEDGTFGGLAAGAATETPGLDDAETSGGGGGFFLPHSDEEMSEADELIMEDHANGDAEQSKGRRRRILESSPEAQQEPLSEPKKIALDPAARSNRACPQRQSESEGSVGDSGAEVPTNGHVGGRAGSNSPTSSPSSDSGEESPLSSEDDYNPISKQRKGTTPAHRKTSGKAGAATTINVSSTQKKSGRMNGTAHSKTPVSRPSATTPDKRRSLRTSSSKLKPSYTADDSDDDQDEDNSMVVSPYFSAASSRTKEKKGKRKA
jgi:xeroderma pigmentosum group C-complementing protein